MSMSSAFCRTQESAQKQRARESRLDNVKALAESAAKAWAAEAVLAEQREARQVRLRAISAAQLAPVPPHDSENPDRGLAQA